MKTLSLVILILALPGMAYAKLSPEQIKLIREVFPSASEFKKSSVKDPISDDPVNTSLYLALKNSTLLGYIRPIETTTGCNSACLPISYMSFYSPKGEYLELKSIPGLTKINHTPFTGSDYAKLGLLLAMAPKTLDGVENPRDMTDALSGATLKKYQNSVVEGAAYSTLRIHLYNQLTIKQILAKSSK